MTTKCVENEVISYFVVKSIEGQYSSWPTHKDIPLGWQAIGNARSKEQCLEYIEQNWTDMTPNSLK